MTDEASGLTKKEVDSLKREVNYWFDQHRLAEKWARDNLHRSRMLMNCLASHGLLDDAGIREAYIEDLASTILADHDRRHLSDFRRDVSSLAVQTQFRQDKVDDDGTRTFDDGEILRAMLKALDRNVARCFDKDMTIAKAREEAEKIIAGIPHAIDDKPDIPVDAIVARLVIAHDHRIEEPSSSSGWLSWCACGQFMTSAPPDDDDGLGFVQQAHAGHVADILRKAGMLRT
jgi:hypothetical protein